MHWSCRSFVPVSCPCQDVLAGRSFDIRASEQPPAVRTRVKSLNLARNRRQPECLRRRADQSCRSGEIEPRVRFRWEPDGSRKPSAGPRPSAGCANSSIGGFPRWTFSSPAPSLPTTWCGCAPGEAAHEHAPRGFVPLRRRPLAWKHPRKMHVLTRRRWSSLPSTHCITRKYSHPHVFPRPPRRSRGHLNNQMVQS